MLHIPEPRERISEGLLRANSPYHSVKCEIQSCQSSLFRIAERARKVHRILHRFCPDETFFCIMTTVQNRLF